MNTSPTDPPDVAKIIGRLERGPYYENDWLIGQLINDDSSNPESAISVTGQPVIKVVGSMPDALFGIEHELAGKIVDNPTFGKQFEFISWRVILPTKGEAIARFLAKSVKWVGTAIANRIIEAYGDGSIAVLRDQPERVAEEIEGLNEVKALEIAQQLREQAEMIEARIEVQHLLAGHRISNKVIEKILSTWRSQAPVRIRANPYELIDFRGINFPTADAIAIGRCEYPKDGEFRQLAAARFALDERCSKDGHTIADRDTITSRVLVLIGVRPSETVLDHPFFEKAPDDKETKRKRLQPATLAVHEAQTSDRMRILCSGQGGWPAQASAEGLYPDQVEALRKIYRHRVSTLDGLPGTGKSVLVGKIVEAIAEQEGPHSVLCVAPTGKAAKRLMEVVPAGVDCRTIHSALQWVVGEKEPRRGRDDPFDAQYIIGDEWSMVGTELNSLFLQAVRDDAYLLHVGDPYQLSPVSPGCVLRDYNRYGIARATLTEVKRNAGALLRGIHAVARGHSPLWPDRFQFGSDRNNLRFIHCEEDEIYTRMLEIFDRMYAHGLDPVWDCQVMTPVNDNGDFSRKVINETLAPRLITESSKYEFRIGEKVIQGRNQKVMDVNGGETPVVNGDLGRVVDVAVEKKGDQVRRFFIVDHWWPDRTAKYPFDDHGLQPAYGLTVHKMQGSSAPYVVIPLHRSQGTQVMSRNWLYTAMSRAERGCIFIGDIARFDLALPRIATDYRKTRLVERLAEAQVPREES